MSLLSIDSPLGSVADSVVGEGQVRPLADRPPRAPCLVAQEVVVVHRPRLVHPEVVVQVDELHHSLDGEIDVPLRAGHGQDLPLRLVASEHDPVVETHRKCR